MLPLLYRVPSFLERSRNQLLWRGEMNQRDGSSRKPFCHVCGKSLEPRICWNCEGAGYTRRFLIFKRTCRVCKGSGALMQCPDHWAHVGSTLRSSPSLSGKKDARPQRTPPVPPIEPSCPRSLKGGPCPAVVPQGHSSPKQKNRPPVPPPIRGPAHLPAATPASPPVTLPAAPPASPPATPPVRPPGGRR